MVLYSQYIRYVSRILAISDVELINDRRMLGIAHTWHRYEGMSAAVHRMIAALAFAVCQCVSV